MDRSLIRRKFGLMDWFLTLSVVSLIVMGIFYIYSAGYQSDDQPVSSFYQKQVVWAAIALILYIGLALGDYRRAIEAAWWIYIVALALLVLVLMVGREVYGATRWLSLFNIQVQPSEFAKLGTVLVLARYLGRPGRRPEDLKTRLYTLGIVVIPFALIARQPDLGTAAVLLPSAFVIMFVAGVPLRFLGVLVLIGVLMLPVAWFNLGDYQKERILVFFDPGRDPLGAGWNKMQSEIAVGSGGLTGKGYLKGTQNILGFLPRTVAPTDFIYSVIAEEAGFVGSSAVLGLYAILLISGIRTATNAPNRYGRILAVGITTMLFGHIFVNIAMTIGLMPITGLPLPLMSYGGSFMLSTMIGLGLMQSVYVHRYSR